MLKQHFRPEFLNRLDEIVYYKPLGKVQIEKILDLLLATLNKRLESKQLRCTLTQEAKDFIIEAAYDPLYGARPLRRYLQQTVETLIAHEILRGKLLPDTILTITVQNDTLVLKL